MESFWEKGSSKIENPIVLSNQFSANFPSKDGGISSMVEFRPVVIFSRKPGTGVRFSYTALSFLEKSLQKWREI